MVILAKRSVDLESRVLNDSHVFFFFLELNSMEYILYQSCTVPTIPHQVCVFYDRCVLIRSLLLWRLIAALWFLLFIILIISINLQRDYVIRHQEVYILDHRIVFVFLNILQILYWSLHYIVRLSDSCIKKISIRSVTLNTYTCFIKYFISTLIYLCNALIWMWILNKAMNTPF